MSYEGVRAHIFLREGRSSRLAEHSVSDAVHLASGLESSLEDGTHASCVAAAEDKLTALLSEQLTKLGRRCSECRRCLWRRRREDRHADWRGVAHPIGVLRTLLAPTTLPISL